MTNSGAKNDILGRIRNAQKIAFEGRDLASDVGIITGEPGAHFSVPRDYERSSELPHKDIVSLADERIADYKADVRRCGSSATEINDAVKKAIADVGASLIGIPEGLDRDWVAGLGSGETAEGATEIRVDTGFNAANWTNSMPLSPALRLPARRPAPFSWTAPLPPGAEP